MTIILILSLVAVVGIAWFYAQRSAAKPNSESGYPAESSDSHGSNHTSPTVTENVEIPDWLNNDSTPISSGSGSGNSVFTQEVKEVNSPDIDKPFANLKSNTAGKVETEVPVEADQTEAVTEKPKRKKRKSPAKSTTTEGEAPAKPKRKYTKRKTDN
jgi:hypothetical protein